MNSAKDTPMADFRTLPHMLSNKEIFGHMTVTATAGATNKAATQILAESAPTLHEALLGFISHSTPYITYGILIIQGFYWSYKIFQIIDAKKRRKKGLPRVNKPRKQD